MPVVAFRCGQAMPLWAMAFIGPHSATPCEAPSAGAAGCRRDRIHLVGDCAAVRSSAPTCGGAPAVG